MQWKFILGLIQMKGLTNVQFVTKNIHKVALEIGIFTACIRIILLDNAPQLESWVHYPKEIDAGAEKIRKKWK